MAFAGLHVSLHRADIPALPQTPDLPVYGELFSSLSSASAEVMTLTVPSDGFRYLARICAAADSWVSIDPAPNASTGKRVLVYAGTPYDTFVKPGDKFAWAVA